MNQLQELIRWMEERMNKTFSVTGDDIHFGREQELELVLDKARSLFEWRYTPVATLGSSSGNSVEQYAEIIERWRHDESMTSHRIAKLLLSLNTTIYPTESGASTTSSESDEQIFYQVKDFVVSAMEKNMTPEECYGLLKALRYKFSREQNVQERDATESDKGGAAGNQETIEGDGWEEKVKEAASSYADSLAEWDSPKWHKRKESFIRGADFAKSELHAQIEQLQAENQKLRAGMLSVFTQCENVQCGSDPYKALREIFSIADETLKLPNPPNNSKQ